MNASQKIIPQNSQVRRSKRIVLQSGGLDLRVERWPVKKLVTGRTLVLDVLTGSSTEGCDLCPKFLIHESAKKGAGRGTVCISNHGNVSVVVGSVNTKSSRPGISLWLERGRIWNFNAKSTLASIMETLGGGI